MHKTINRVATGAVLAGVAALAACTTPAPPPPPPPPPPPVVRATAEPIPYRPIPPGGAPYVMEVPLKDAAGVRQTVNTGLDPVETLWNFRSGWNVAALNCNGVDDARIIPGYSAFLRTFARQLTSANTELDRRVRRNSASSASAVRAREARMTAVYNYFAQPPARGDFCAAARAISAQMLDTPPADATAFAQVGLPALENAFERFFSQYEEYQISSAAWDARYGAQYGASQPGYVAVHGTPGAGIASSLIAQQANDPLTLTAAPVIDPATGVAIPVIPAAGTEVATPIVQPLSNGASQRRR